MSLGDALKLITEETYTASFTGFSLFSDYFYHLNILSAKKINSGDLVKVPRR